uniref:50S ribosomal protein L17 n=1 Tax=Arcella intermedia TaxID=1963864 RepID=A0A6B2LQX4_9EUKA
MMKNMATSLILYGQIKTTLAKAKEVRRFADRLIVRAKGGTMHDRRQAERIVNNTEAMNRLFNEYSLRYRYRSSGFTRMHKAGFRKGDGAQMAIVELIRDDETMVPADYGVDIVPEL